MTTHDTTLPRSAPEAQGIPSAAVTAFLEAAEQTSAGLHSFMLLRHGHVVAEGWWSPYQPHAPHMLFSLSKSFTSTAIGLAVAEGRLSVDDPVLAFFPAEAPRKPSAHLAAMRVRHLLSMSTGHDHDTTGYMWKRRDGDWARAFLARPVAHEPGAHFLYNTGATYMLSAIIQRVTGTTLLEYLRPRLFEPLGIANPTWETCPRGVNTGGFGLSITTEDIARFGQMYLQRGAWDGQQLVPEAWVAAASTKQIANDANTNPDWQQGYGYQFWRCRHGAYRGDGAFGQFCVILPAQDAVLAITAGTPNMQAVLDQVWAHLLPAMGPAPLSPVSAAHAALQAKLQGLVLPHVTGTTTPLIAAQLAGRQYRFSTKRAPLRAIAFDFDPAGDVCTVQDEYGEHRLILGRDAWAAGAAAWDPLNARSTVRAARRPIAANGGWIAGDTYELRIYYTETPFCVTAVCKFVGDKVKLKLRVNVSFGPTEFPQLTGLSDR
jgi:CubicO group peptidase (beta-lactamase class C family)